MCFPEPTGYYTPQPEPTGYYTPQPEPTGYYTPQPTPRTCASNEYLTADGTCQTYQPCNFYYNGQCVDKCPSGMLEQYGRCVERCEDSTYRNGTSCVYMCQSGVGYNGTCLSKCPPEAPNEFYGKCFDKCPMGSYPNNGICDYNCPGFWLNTTCVERCPPSMVFVYDKYCTDNCPFGFQLKGQNCSNPCQMNQYVDGNGRCVDYPTNICEEGQWYFNNTCMPACKEGEFMDMNGKCNNPQRMCEQGLPGGVYNPTTYKCDCPEGHWMKRNNSFVPPVACAPIPPDVPKPYPHIACKSFIPYTVFDFNLDTCVCDADHPVIVNNPKDSFVPYTCEVAGTPTTIKPCDGGMYFDFIEGECNYPKDTIRITPTFTPYPSPTYTVRPSYTPFVSIQVTSKPSPCPDGMIMTVTGCVREGGIVMETPTLKPQPTSTATRTALPSRKPSMSSTPTRSAKPSDRPNSVTSTPSASRSVKPSNRIFADVSRKPLPSIDLQPPPADVKRSPAPSAWPKKMIMDIPQEERPSYIDAKVKLPGGNVTEMTKPEKIQDMQASLACALRMPLENIRITSIVYVDDKGVKQTLDVDPTKFMMMGDGDIGCYSRNKTASARRLGAQRNLQSKGSIDVDYSIIQPSDDILSMDTTQMNEVIATSPVILEVAASVGSSSVESAAVEASLNAAPSPAPSGVVTSSTGTDSTFATFQGYVGGGIAGFAVFGGLVIALIFYYKENKRNKRLLKEQQDKAVVQQPKQIILQINGEQIQNPMAVIQSSVHRADSTRFDYGPENTRRSAVSPLKSTHKHVVS